MQNREFKTHWGWKYDAMLQHLEKSAFDYYSKSTPYGDALNRAEIKDDAIVEFYTTFSLKSNYKELVLDAVNLGIAKFCLTTSYENTSIWGRLIEEKATEAMNEISSLVGISCSSLDSIVLEEKLKLDIITAIKGKDVDVLKEKVELAQKNNLNINLIVDKEELTLLEILLKYGYYNMVAKFNFLIKAGIDITFDIVKYYDNFPNNDTLWYSIKRRRTKTFYATDDLTLSEKILFYTFDQYPTHVELFKIVLSQCQPKNINRLRSASRGQKNEIYFNPLESILDSLLSKLSSSNRVDYNPFVESIKFLSTHGVKLNKEIINKGFQACDKSPHAWVILTALLTYPDIGDECKKNLETKINELKPKENFSQIHKHGYIFSTIELKNEVKEVKEIKGIQDISQSQADQIIKLIESNKDTKLLEEFKKQFLSYPPLTMLKGDRIRIAYFYEEYKTQIETKTLGRRL